MMLWCMWWGNDAVWCMWWGNDAVVYVVGE